MSDLTRMVFAKCANPKCWRYFPRPADSQRTCCDDACDAQRVGVQAMQARLDASGRLRAPEEAAS